MKKKLLKLLFIFNLLAFTTTAFAQTVVIEVDGGGSATICSGSSIQLNTVVTPENPNLTYNWRNLTTGQFLQTGQGDPGSFIILDLEQTSEIQVEVFGIPGSGGISDTIDIIVEEAGNPGTEGNLILCNQMGTVDLFTLLQGFPDAGGVWSPPLSGGNGNFVVGVDTPGTYTYTLQGNDPCPDTSSEVIVTDCFNEDFDGDGVLNDVDLDDDNDGILDAVENATCNVNSLTETRPIVDRTFGQGDTPTTDPFILGHGYSAIWPNDGTYNVGTSTFFSTSDNFVPIFVMTESNPIPNSDGDGTLEGRYLAVNVVNNQAGLLIYEIPNIPIQQGTQYNFRIDMAGLCVNCTQVPELDLQLIDQNLPAGSPPIFNTNSGAIGVDNNDIWTRFALTFTATTSTFVSLQIINQQPQGNDGNDLGIDNIFFAPLECDFDLDQIPNFLDLDSDNDGIFDVVEALGDLSINLDANNDGIIDGPVDANGVPVAANGGINPVNSDGQAGADYLDIDADNDGILDLMEGQTTAGYILPSGIDADQNGVDDVFDMGANPVTPEDTDGDGMPDYLDLNSDNDCLSDNVEAYDLNQDGVADILPSGNDTDEDGYDNAYDVTPLIEINSVINPSDNGELTSNLPDNHQPGNDVDFRDEFIEVIEMFDLDLCNQTNAVFNLFDSLVDTALPNGVWSGPSPLGGGELGTFDTAINTSGVYIYTLPAIGNCPERRGEVTVLLGQVLDPGVDDAVTLCDTGNPVDLFTILGGTPDAGGIWTPALNSGTGVFDPAIDLAGTYTYTLTGTNACPDASATVEVTLENAPNAGIDETLSICTSDNPIDLITVLGGTPDAGGVWTPVLNSGTGVFDPSIDLAGTYIYTLTGTNPCPDDSAMVEVTLENAPDAGIDETLAICTTDNPVDLITVLGGTPDAGGVWTPALNSGTGVFDPAIDLSGTYTYTLTGTNPCPDDSATVVVTVENAPNAGIDEIISICASDNEIDLFTVLGGTPDAGGIWSPALNSGTGVFDPAVDLAGTYTYTLTGTNPCPDDSATVVVTVINAPNAGLDETLTVCDTDNPVDLFTVLGGTPDAGGIWSPALNSGTGVFDPATDLAGTYTYTLAGTNGCPDATATVEVTVENAPNAGIDETLSICASDNAIDLFTVLGGTPDAGGVWSPALNSGSGVFDPAIDLSGTYTYTLTGTNPCPDDSATVVVTVINAPNAGLDETLTVCATDNSVDLFTVLGGTPDAGGIWSPALNSGSGVFDPATDLAGIYTYTLAGTNGCPDATATVDVTVGTPVDAGLDETLFICASDNVIDLFTVLGGTPDAGGVWTPALNSGTGVFDPAVDTAGDYTYTLTGINGCPDAAAIVAVTVGTPVDAGTDGAITLCAIDASVDLFTVLGGTPDAGGVWSPALNSGTGVFDPAIDAAGDYTYTLIGTNGCPDATAIIAVTVGTPVDAGTDGAITLCASDNPVDLFTILGGTPDAGGVWTPALNSGTGVFDPTIDIAGDYTYTLTGMNGCPDATAIVAVTVGTPVDAGTDGAISLCTTENLVDLFTILGGTPDVGGVWSPALNSGTGVFDPAVDAAGDYTYTLIGTNGCPDATAIIAVVVETPVDAGSDGAISLCTSEDPIDLFTVLGGTPDAGGLWTPALSSGTGVFNPAIDTAGDYIYTASGNGICPDVSATVSVTINTASATITPTDLLVCDDDGTPDSFTLLDLTVKNIEITNGLNSNAIVSYHLTQDGANANDASIPDPTAFMNTVNPQIVFARVTDNDTGCFSVQPLRVEIFLNPPTITPANLEVCDPDNDGIFDFFVLANQDEEITNGDPSLTVTYYLTEQDANNAPVGLEIDPLMFINNEPFNQTVWARVSNSVGCFTVVPQELVILNTPMPNENPDPFQLCDNNADGVAFFDLTSQETQILDGLDPLIFTVTWFANQANADAGTPQIANPTAYQSNTNTVVAVITDIAQSTTTFCTATVTLELIVNELPVPVQPEILELCDDLESGSDVDEFATFDLRSRDDEITGGNDDWVVSYHLTQNDADAGTPTLPDMYQNEVMANQTVWVRVEDIVTGCYDLITMTLVVNPLPSPTTIPALEECDDDGDGEAVFDLSTDVTTAITNGEAFVTLTFHQTPEAAEIGTPFIADPANYTGSSGTLWVRATDTNPATTTECFRVVELELLVLPSPTLPQDIPDITACDENGNGQEVIDITINQSTIIGTQSSTELTITYHETLMSASAAIGSAQDMPIADPLNYLITASPTTIFVRLENNVSGCTNIGEFNVLLAPTPIFNEPPAILEACDSEGPSVGTSDDGITLFDLTSLNNEITGGNPELSVSYFETQADLNAGNAITPADAYINTGENPQTIFIQISSSQPGMCMAQRTIDLIVNPLPTIPESLLTLTTCDEDNDGFGVFDLLAYANNLLANAALSNIRFYETFDNAQENDLANSLDPIVPYTNISQMAQLYIVVQIDDPSATTGCSAIFEVDLLVLPLPELPTEIAEITLCDDNEDGQEFFDLTQNEDIILGVQDPALFMITYHNTQASAEDATPADAPYAPIQNVTNYTSTGTPDAPEIIWVRLENSDSTGGNCFIVGTFELIVNPIPVINPTGEQLDIDVCDDDDDEVALFDLTINQDLYTGGVNSLDVVYYASLADLANGTPINNPSAYENVINPQTIQIVVSSQTDCLDTGSFDIAVLPLPTPNFNPTAPLLCDAVTDIDIDGDGTIDPDTGSDTDGIEIFDLTAVIEDIRDNENSTVTVFTELAFAEADPLDTTNAIADVTAFTNTSINSQTLYARVDSNALGNACFVIVPFNVIVTPLPILDAAFDGTHTFCENFDGDDTMGDLDLTTLADEIGLLAPPQSTADFTITYYTTEAAAENGFPALSSPYEVTEDADGNGELLFIRIENNANGCTTITTVTVTVESSPLSMNPEDIVMCADNLGINIFPEQDTATFDLTNQDALITTGIAGVGVTYYISLADAEDETNPITTANAFINTANPQTIWARAQNTATACAGDIVSFDLIVEPLPYTDLTAEGGDLCVDENTEQVLEPFTIDGTVQTQLPNAQYTYLWTLDGIFLSQDPIIPINEAGTYQLTITAAYTDAAGFTTLCEYTAEVIYTPVSAPIFEAIVLEGSFNSSGLYTVEIQNITAQGDFDLSDFEFAIDDGPFQSSTTFEGVRPGTHIVSGRRIAEGCNIGQVEISIIDYPRFFTPNSDGFHDTWNIIGLGTDPNLDAKIFIFDRFGKLLKQLSPTGIGWNGTFNGRPMPSSDYWFRVEFTEPNEEETQRVFNGHFTLKR